MDHAVGVGDAHRQVLDDRERDLDAELFLDVADPRQVRVDAVDRQAEQLAVDRREIRGRFREGGELDASPSGRAAS